MLSSGEQLLAAHVEFVNSLNVFPVPDGDTGTNMLLTMRAAMQAVGRASEAHAGRIAAAAAQGALMGARGNSGVILSQILGGLAHGLEGKEWFSAADFAAAVQLASEMAYKSVVRPVEGTILTVIREAAAAARAASARTRDVVELLAAALEAAREANARTPEELPILKQAGVVDAGGQGLLYILEGSWRFLKGEHIDVGQIHPAPAAVQARLSHDEEPYGYDVQFLIHGQGLDVPAIRAAIDAMGNSTLVVGDEHLVKVHVHVPDPGPPLSFGCGLGAISDVVVENMDEQHHDFALRQARALTASETLTNTATVCVVPGEGLQQIFESLGASAIVPGGQTMNPSTEELLAAVERVAADHVLILPNNGNVILTAQQVEKFSQKMITVVPTRTIPQGIGALVAFNFQADAATNAPRMLEAARKIQTIEVTRAVRATRLNGVEVAEGNAIGLLNEELVSSSPDLETVVIEALSHLPSAEYEVADIYFGADVTAAEASALANRIREIIPGLEIEIHSGGQAHYPYIISLE